jgi:hypothetical protein
MAVTVHPYDSAIADFNFYILIPLGISVYNFYVAFQAFNNPVAVAQTLNLTQTEAQLLYAQLLPSLGYDFLSQFNEVELLSFYLQTIDFNIELSLVQFLTNASINSMATLLVVSHPSSTRKQELFTSII